MIPTPFRYRDMVGPPENYFIHAGYTPRLDNAAFDDTPLTDEYQRQVYEYARAVMDRESLNGVCDVGCGSGYKLTDIFRGQRTLGLDLPETVAFLKEKYPFSEWQAVDLATDRVWGYELLICSDVIEHLQDPGALMRFLQRSNAKRVILSTPERDELNHGTWDGPPHNVHHVREWNFAELHAYARRWFAIHEHFVVAGTQILDLSAVA